MATQNGNAPSRSGSVVFIATTTVAVEVWGESSMGTRIRTTQPFSITAANLSGAQTPSSTQDRVPLGQGSTSDTTRSSSMSIQSWSPSSDPPDASSSLAPSNVRGQEAGNGRQDSIAEDSDSENHNTILIASITTVVGTLVIALILLLVLLRRRKKRSYSEIIRLKPGSIDVSALPVYQKEYGSSRTVRSTQVSGAQDVRPLTAASLATQPRRFLSVPKASAARPDRVSLDLYDKTSAKKSVEMLQRTHGIRRYASLPPMSQTRMVGQHSMGLSDQRPLSYSRSERSSSSSLNCPEGRWSWTNSQAPSTPRIAAPNTRASLTGRSIRSVRSWFAAQESEHRSQSQQSHRRQRSNPLLLKNQAHRPVLAPRRPAVKRPSSSLRAKAGHLSESMARGRRSNASHRRDDQRPMSLAIGTPFGQRLIFATLPAPPAA